MTLSMQPVKVGTQTTIERPAPQHAPREQLLLTFKEAMEFLRVSRSTLYRLMWSGQLQGHKVGSTWRFYQHDLLDVVASPAQQPSQLMASQDVNEG